MHSKPIRTVTAVLLALCLAPTSTAADPVRHGFLATGGETLESLHNSGRAA